MDLTKNEFNDFVSFSMATPFVMFDYYLFVIVSSLCDPLCQNNNNKKKSVNDF